VRLVIDGRRLTAERTGVGRVLESLLAEWSVTGFPLPETVVVLRDRAGLERIPAAPGLRAELVGQRWPGMVWECLGLRRALKPNDVLFAPSNLVPLNWSGRTVLVIFDTLLWSVPESFPRHVRWRFAWRYRQAARRADRVLVPSRATAADVIRVHQVPAERVRVIHPGPEPGFRPLAPGSEEVIQARRSLRLGDGPFFLFVGKRSRRRNIPVILDAFARHRGRHPGHLLVFAGPDPRDGVPGRDAGIVRAGHVPDPVLHGLMAAAVALLYPSDYEGFGLPVLEALAGGCPVITLRNSALTESGGDAPWYLDAAEVEPLARAMHVLSSDASIRAGHIARGLAHAARFSRARFASAVRAELGEGFTTNPPFA
jgi:glycosyltransferase involved in cell wall biosynthesis